MRLDGNRVREIAKEKGYTLSELSLRLGMNYRAVSDYCLGRKHISRRKIEQLADILDVNWVDIVNLSNSYY